MFQVSNPLRFYSQNPNAGDDDDADAVPTLHESQLRSKRIKDIGDYIIYGCALLLLVILLITIASALWKAHQERTTAVEEDDTFIQETQWNEEPKIETIIEKVVVEEEIVTKIPEEDLTIVKNEETMIERKITIIEEPSSPPKKQSLADCTECLDYDELVQQGKLGTRMAEKYINDKLDESIRIDLDTQDDERISTMEGFIDRIDLVPRALKPVNDFLYRNKSFGTHLADAEKCERDTHLMRAQYETKVFNIGNYTVRALSLIGEIGDARKQNEKVEKELEDTKANLQKKLNDLRDERYNLEHEVREMKNNLAKALANLGVRSEGDLDNLIAKTRELIAAKEKEKSFCDRKIAENQKHIKQLEIHIYEAKHSHDSVTLQLIQWNWVKHVMETINKLEQIKVQVKELQTSQLIDGRNSIFQLIASLKAKEDDYINRQRDLDSSTSSESVSTTTDEYGRTVTKVVTFESTRKSDLATHLKEYIQKEQNLLKVWSREQFKTIRLSTDEIRNLTNSINDHRYRIRDLAEEYQKYTLMLESISANITKMQTTIREQQLSIASCQDAILEASGELAKAKAELQKLNDLKAQLKQGGGLVAQKEARLNAITGEIDKDSQYRDALLRSIQGRIDGFRDRIADLTNQLREITGKLNGVIAADPQPKDVEKNIGEYKDKIRTSNEIYADLNSLLKEINRILC